MFITAFQQLVKAVYIITQFLARIFWSLKTRCSGLRTTFSFLASNVPAAWGPLPLQWEGEGTCVTMNRSCGAGSSSFSCWQHSRQPKYLRKLAAVNAIAKRWTVALKHASILNNAAWRDWTAIAMAAHAKIYAVMVAIEIRLRAHPNNRCKLYPTPANTNSARKQNVTRCCLVMKRSFTSIPVG
jgi:hypothetical protein